MTATSPARRALRLIVLLLPLYPSMVWAAETEARQEVAEIDEECLVCPVSLVKPWRFHAGDDPAWADPALDDSSWALVDPSLSHLEQLPDGWPGIGWFRRRIRTTEGFGEVPLGLYLVQAGASEIYLDGKRVLSFGTVSAAAEQERPLMPRYVASITLEPEIEHLLAVRYSNSTGNVLGQRFRGFHLTVGEIQALTERGISEIRWASILEGLTIGIFGALGVLHFLLFAFTPKQRDNILFALFAGLLVAFLVIDIKANSLSELSRVLVYYKIVLTLSMSVALAALILALRLLRRPAGWIVYLFAAAALGVAVWLWSQPTFTPLLPVAVVGSLICLETLRQVILALVRRQPEAWVIGLGFLSLAVVFLLNVARNLGLLSIPTLEIFVAGTAILALSFSLYLTRRVARTNRELETKLDEVETLTARTIEQERRAAREEAERRLLEADNERKTAELEEARRLQLALLPRRIPQPEGLSIAVHMTTANEVGGDYYDCAANGDGSLTLAVGDAVGHGLTAGMVVAVAKSLFQSACREKSLSAALARIGGGLEDMHLRLASMAMILARVEGRRIRVASAGMPPLLVWRQASGEVEEVMLPSVPLGTMRQDRFEERDLELEPGDAALVMTDGLAEVTDPEGELLGYERAGRWFAELAGEAPERVIRKLIDRCRRYLDGTPLRDDLTLLVLKAS